MTSCGCRVLDVCWLPRLVGCGVGNRPISFSAASRAMRAVATETGVWGAPEGGAKNEIRSCTIYFVEAGWRGGDGAVSPPHHLRVTSADGPRMVRLRAELRRTRCGESACWVVCGWGCGWFVAGFQWVVCKWRGRCGVGAVWAMGAGRGGWEGAEMGIRSCTIYFRPP